MAAAKAGEFLEHGWGGAAASAELARGYYVLAGGKGEDGIRRLEEEERTKAELQRLNEAAEGGDADSQVQLGRVLEYGQMGAAVDLDKAERLYRQAADAGNSQGQYQLGLFMIKVRAKELLLLASNQGNWDASSCANKIYNYF
jgi:hypothetical protein